MDLCEWEAEEPDTEVFLQGVGQLLAGLVQVARVAGSNPDGSASKILLEKEKSRKTMRFRAAPRPRPAPPRDKNRRDRLRSHRGEGASALREIAGAGVRVPIPRGVMCIFIESCSPGSFLNT